MKAVLRATRLVVIALAVIAAPAAVHAQSALLQGGPVTPGHIPMYINGYSQQPIVIDSGPAAGGLAGTGLSELGLTARGNGTPPYANAGTGNLGTNFCDYDAPTTNATGYHSLCFSPNAQGGGLIAYNAFGTASPLPFTIEVNGQNFTFPGYVNCIGCGTISSQNANNVAITGGTIAIPPGNTFWGTPGGPYATIQKLADRLFVGPAAAMDGIFYPSGCPTCGSGALSKLTWFDLLSNQSYNGGVGVFSNAGFSQMVVLQNPTSADAEGAYPSPALVVAAETLNSPTGSTVEALDLTAVNNSVSGQNPGAWALYIEAHRVGTSTTNTYGIEDEVRNSTSLTSWDPFTTNGAGSIGLEFGCGAGLSSTGQYGCTVGEYFAANPEPWQTGILFFPGSIAASGPSSSVPAIAMPPSYSILWYTASNTLGATVTGFSGGALGLSSVGTFSITTGGAVAMTISSIQATTFNGSVTITTLPAGTPATYACFNSAHTLISSATAC
jgi:hypothetical protein